PKMLEDHPDSWDVPLQSFRRKYKECTCDVGGVTAISLRFNGLDRIMGIVIRFGRRIEPDCSFNPINGLSLAVTSNGDATRVLLFQKYGGSDTLKPPFDFHFMDGDGARKVMDHVVAEGGALIQRGSAVGDNNRDHTFKKAIRSMLKSMDEDYQA
ncbi:MAG: hypothetical protein Q9183_002942, partial [Haloplaca sp. 2 TL-2023]